MSPVTPIFRYIPKSCRKDGEAPFSECTTLKSATKPISKLKETDWHALKGKVYFQLIKMAKAKWLELPSLVLSCLPRAHFRKRLTY